MKKTVSILLSALLLLGGLTGCGIGRTETTLPAPPSADPTESQSGPEETAEPPAAPETVPEDALLTTPELVFCGNRNWKLRGPAGTVDALTYLGGTVEDPVFADLDGDGQEELLYHCSGPTSGVSTFALCAYGLEQGWPVLKAAQIYQYEWGELGLGLSDGKARVGLVSVFWHPGADEHASCAETVTMENGGFLLSGEAFTEEFEDWGFGPEWYLFGSAFGALGNTPADSVLLRDGNCLVWQNRESVYNYDAGQYVDGIGYYAAASANGVTVTGVLRWTSEKTGFPVFQKGIHPIPPMEDPELLTGLTAEQLTERFGPCHFCLGGDTERPCWFTEDCRLLAVTLEDAAVGALLWDLTEGSPFPDD